MTLFSILTGQNWNQETQNVVRFLAQPIKVSIVEYLGGKKFHDVNRFDAVVSSCCSTTLEFSELFKTYRAGAGVYTTVAIHLKRCGPIILSI